MQRLSEAPPLVLILGFGGLLPFLAGAIGDTVVVSPRIASADGSCRDTLAPNEVSYACGGDSWKSGGNAKSHPEISSFDFMDEIVRRLADKKTFPNLASVVIAGHSAGGQFANRYSMANKIHGTLGVAMTLMYPGIFFLPPLFGYAVDLTHSWRGAWSVLAGVLLLGVGIVSFT